MAAGKVAVQMVVEDHQALVALLKYLAGETTLEDFQAVLRVQGRASQSPANMVKVMAEYLVRMVS